MQNNIKISVITGIYHPNEHLFRKFLYSCLNQTLDNIQFVMIFDDPEDKESRRILEEYKEVINNNKNTFTILENSQNLGIYATQMKGLKNSLGEYVVFFDNDDFFDLEYLETMYRYAKEFDANVIKGLALTHYFGDIDLNFTFVCKHEDIFNEDDWLYMYKKEFFNRYFDFSTMYTSDNSIAKKINKHTEKDFIIQIPLYEGVFYHYVRHCDNTSFVPSIESEVDKENNEDQERIYKRFAKDLEEEFGIIESKKDIQKAIQNKLKLDTKPNNFTFDQLKGL